MAVELEKNAVERGSGSFGCRYRYGIQYAVLRTYTQYSMYVCRLSTDWGCSRPVEILIDGVLTLFGLWAREKATYSTECMDCDASLCWQIAHLCEPITGEYRGGNDELSPMSNLGKSQEVKDGFGSIAFAM